MAEEHAMRAELRAVVLAGGEAGARAWESRGAGKQQQRQQRQQTARWLWMGAQLTTAETGG